MSPYVSGLPPMFFDAVRNNKRVVQIFLGLITLPFAFWGVDSYVRNTGAGTDLARVGDSKISIQQFDQALRTQQERLRQVLGANFRPELMNTPAAKLAVLNSLIDQRLLLLEAAKGRLGAGDDLLREVISQIPALQEDGNAARGAERTLHHPCGELHPAARLPENGYDLLHLIQ